MMTLLLIMVCILLFVSFWQIFVPILAIAGIGLAILWSNAKHEDAERNKRQEVARQAEQTAADAALQKRIECLTLIREIRGDNWDRWAGYWQAQRTYKYEDQNRCENLSRNVYTFKPQRTEKAYFHGGDGKLAEMEVYWLEPKTGSSTQCRVFVRNGQILGYEPALPNLGPGTRYHESTRVDPNACYRAGLSLKEPNRSYPFDGPIDGAVTLR